MSVEREYVIESQLSGEPGRIHNMVAHMAQNKAYCYAAQGRSDSEKAALLEEYKQRFLRYRTNWRGNPAQAIEGRLHHDSFARSGINPQCVDIETAAVCDLVCPFCYRQWIVTPDRLISEELCFRIIDQCAQLGVPSLKFNWRGEPLLHPKLADFIAYAKKKGILETIINTNAVTLDAQKSEDLIEAGLDLIIYSFDGGTKASYEKMRVGRFQHNNFDIVYENIKRFAAIRAAAGAFFPRTKIQMILTEDTFPEKELFINLFSSCVDDVSVKAYTERGGNINDIEIECKAQVGQILQSMGLEVNKAHLWRNSKGQLFVAAGRLPCEQIYQRLMVSYDGRVSMCCYDWGCEYPVGYLDERAYINGDQDYYEVLEKAKARANGYTFFDNAKMPERYVLPEKKVSTLSAIWHGSLLNAVRELHAAGKVDAVAICRKCTFKETYEWKEVIAE